MNRFLLIVGMKYQHIFDVVGSFGSIDEAAKSIPRKDYGSGFPMDFDPTIHFYAVIDKETDKVVDVSEPIDA